MSMKSISNKKIVQPLFIYISTRKKYWIQCFVALLIALVFFCYFCFFDINKRYDIIDLFDNFIDSLISGISILLSFSIAVLTIFVTANNSNIEIVKSKKADQKYKKLKCNSDNNEDATLNLYQVLLSSITYCILIQIIFLLILFFEMFLKTVVDIEALKAFVSINVFIMLLIFFALYEIVLNLFYTFWKTDYYNSQ